VNQHRELASGGRGAHTKQRQEKTSRFSSRLLKVEIERRKSQNWWGNRGVLITSGRGYGKEKKGWSGLQLWGRGDFSQGRENEKKTFR